MDEACSHPCWEEAKSRAQPRPEGQTLPGDKMTSALPGNSAPDWWYWCGTGCVAAPATCTQVCTCFPHLADMDHRQGSPGPSHGPTALWGFQWPLDGS